MEIKRKDDKAFKSAIGKERFADNLRVIMQEKDINIPELSELSGLKTTNLYKYTLAVSLPSKASQKELARALNITVEKLMEGVE